MTHIEFFPYHNRHIRFRLKNGTELSGVLTDKMSERERDQPRTLYDFIPTRNMIEWKKAEKNADYDKMKGLEKEIDIEDIVWAELISY